MHDDVTILFERELARRGLAFRRDLDSGRYILNARGLELVVSLDNIVREYRRDADPTRITRFVDTVLAADVDHAAWPQAQGSIFHCLEPSDHVERSELRSAVSDRVDRVPVLFAAATGRITWVSEAMLHDWQITMEELAATALANLASLLTETRIEHNDIDGVRLGHFASSLPFKSALMLAPNLRQRVEPLIGWPLYAVAPARDFLYLWAAEHADFAGRVGGVVVDEFTKSGYPISTEVFEISDGGIKAIGAFATEADGQEN
jgi:uncharacterized protein YtpQ (UPF0354 family)